MHFAPNWIPVPACHRGHCSSPIMNQRFICRGMTQYKLLNNGFKKKKKPKPAQGEHVRLCRHPNRSAPHPATHSLAGDADFSPPRWGGSRFQEASAPRFLKSCGSPGPRAPAGPGRRTKFPEVEASGGRAGPGWGWGEAAPYRALAAGRRACAAPAPRRPAPGPPAAEGAGCSRRGWSRPPPATRRAPYPRPRRSAGSGALGASSAAVRSVLLPGQPHVGGRGRAGGRRRRRLESPCWAATRLAHAAAAPRRAPSPSRTLSQALPLARWKSPPAAGARPGARPPRPRRQAPRARTRGSCGSPRARPAPRAAAPRAPARPARTRLPLLSPPAWRQSAGLSNGATARAGAASGAPSACQPPRALPPPPPAPRGPHPGPPPLSGSKSHASLVGARKVQVPSQSGAMASPGSAGQPLSVTRTRTHIQHTVSHNYSQTQAQTHSANMRSYTLSVTLRHTCSQDMHTLTDTCSHALGDTLGHRHDHVLSHLYTHSHTHAPSHPCTRHTHTYTLAPTLVPSRPHEQVVELKETCDIWALISFTKQGAVSALVWLAFPCSLGSSHTQEVVSWSSAKSVASLP